MTVKGLLDKLENGATKINIIDKEGVLVFMGIWFNDIDKNLYNSKIKKLEVKDYSINIFL